MANFVLGVVDYGMGNLHSVAKSLEAVLPSKNARLLVTDDRGRLEKCSALVVPGQGRFDRAMTTLSSKKLVGFLKRWIKDGRPFLGVCLGLQVLFEGSEEARGVPGLGLLPGRVKRFRPRPGLKIPHMGWNQAIPVGTAADNLFGGGNYYYFVHSYYAPPLPAGGEGATTPYGVDFCSAVVNGSVVATQFHPEKSGTTGLSFLKNVMTLWTRR